MEKTIMEQKAIFNELENELKIEKTKSSKELEKSKIYVNEYNKQKEQNEIKNESMKKLEEQIKKYE